MNFDNQIKSNRNRLDTDEPDMSAMWSEIDQKLGKPKKRIFYWMAAAAGFALLATLTILWPKQEKPLADNADKVELMDDQFRAEQAEINLQYQSTLARLSTYSYKEADLQVFVDELTALNTMEQELILRLPTAVNQEKVLASILEQQKKKIRVLERMIRDLEKKQRHEKRKTADYV